jgi:hypothetical protein
MLTAITRTRGLPVLISAQTAGGRLPPMTPAATEVAAGVGVFQPPAGAYQTAVMVHSLSDLEFGAQRTAVEPEAALPSLSSAVPLPRLTIW